MTAKEKANELVRKFSPKLLFYTEKDNTQKSKECALICVDDILSFIEESDPQALSYEMFGYRDYWREVKEEIGKRLYAGRD